MEFAVFILFFFLFCDTYVLLEKIVVNNLVCFLKRGLKIKSLRNLFVQSCAESKNVVELKGC